MTLQTKLWWYHARLSLSWRVLAPLLFYLGILALFNYTLPAEKRGHDMAAVLETGIPLFAALLAAPLLVGEYERNTLTLLATRVSLHRVLVVRGLLLTGYVLAVIGVSMLSARLLWSVPWQWETMLHTAATAVAFAAGALLAAALGRSIVAGYIPTIGFWLGTLMSTAIIPRHDPWLTLNPFAAAFGYSADVVVHSKLLYAAIGALLLLAQWRLLRRPMG